MTLLDELRAFTRQAPIGGRRWLASEVGSIYVRHAKRHLEGALRETLDVASVEIAEAYQGRGFMRRWLEEAHRLHPWGATYIENVIHEGWAKALERDGWKRTGHTVLPSFYRLKTE